MHQVFVYGTLKQGEPNFEVLTDRSNGYAEFVGAGQTTVQFPLVIATKCNIPFLLNYPGRGYQITGEVFEVDDEMLQFLDDFEGCPQCYQREEVVVKYLDEDDYSQERFTTCWVYLLNKYNPLMLEMPFSEMYSSAGFKSQSFIPSEELEDMNELLP